MRQSLKRHRAILFMLLTCLIGWIPWYTGSEGLIFAAPMLAALIVAGMVGGWADAKTILRRMVHWRVRPGWYLLVLLLPAATSLIAVAAHAVTGGVPPQFPVFKSNQHLILLTWVFSLLPWQSSAFLEEVGLRGYAQEEMQNQWGALPGSLVLGVFFGAWLLPEFLREGSAQFAMGGLAFLPWFILTEIGWSLIMAWVYNRTDKSSLVSGYLFHTAFNVWPMLMLTIAIPGEPLPVFDTRLFVINALVVAVAGAVVALATKGKLGMSAVAPSMKPGKEGQSPSAG